ncbi:hypothetical protein OGATHE_002440 [Ogataea polymorpha]|uniref:Uncharacterized protein n=1 Tax=Ogataea polymorpha TaxID=460523 RepID=A0A9P8PCB1_9ASCO|nr:hypothetical protein OGATHE_002440 [Ogataea polymorpha]
MSVGACTPEYGESENDKACDSNQLDRSDPELCFTKVLDGQQVDCHDGGPEYGNPDCHVQIRPRRFSWGRNVTHHFSELVHDGPDKDSENEEADQKTGWTTCCKCRASTNKDTCTNGSCQGDKLDMTGLQTTLGCVNWFFVL